MNAFYNKFNVSRKIELICLWIVLFANASFSTTHVVTFTGMVYTPSTFNALVGDTVKWQGSFSFHPLSSTTIPSQAASWHQATGSSFSYVIKFAGTFHYQCDVHVSLGMIGSFTATDPHVGTVQDFSFQKSGVFQGVSSLGQNRVVFSLPSAERVTVTLFTALGKEVERIGSGMMMAGSHEIILGHLTKGFYFVKLSIGSQNTVKSLEVVQ